MANARMVRDDFTFILRVDSCQIYSLEVDVDGSQELVASSSSTSTDSFSYQFIIG